MGIKGSCRGRGHDVTFNDPLKAGMRIACSKTQTLKLSKAKTMKASFTIFHQCEKVAEVTGKDEVKAYMVQNQLSFVFVVRDDGQAYNVKLQNGRCTLMSA